MMWGYGNAGWGGFLAMTVMMVLFWGVIIFGVVAAVRAFSAPRHVGAGGHGISSAEMILSERFARGDLTDDEFRQRLDALRSIHRNSGA